MNLPFTTDEFLGVFERYNEAIWPLHVVAYALGLVAVALAIRPRPHSSRVVAAILGAFWLWMGLVYHLVFFRQINPAAMLFGLTFVLQGLLWLWAGVVHPRLSFRAGSDLPSLVGGAFVVYGMVVYPIIGAQLGHDYRQSPSFGVAPCPVTIFTFGLLLWTERPVPRLLLVIPLLWSLLGVSAAISLDVGEDLGLVVAGLLGTALLVWRDHRAVGGGVLRHRPA